MKNFTILCLTVVFTVLSVVTNLSAGSVVIRDSRINDLAVTPALGRGYTLATNTFQSMCMEDVVTTEPSYDFQYRFESIETGKSTAKTLNTSTEGSYSRMGVEVMAKTALNMSSSANETSHNIKVELNMNTYYASVDEAKSKLSQTSENLLKEKDLPGFFQACGSTYIRSLGRNAKFVSIFTYTTKSTQRDVAFEAQLQLQIKGFGAALMGGSGSVSNTTSGSFSSAASEKKLIITTWAWGLGKNEGASLISYDLETFKQSIKEAFISMQNTQTGRVTTMEVVPWVENTSFQDAVDLEEKDGQAEGERVPNYKKKHVLNLNGEFLGEIEKADRNKMNNYYKAKICKETIRVNYKQDDRFLEGYENAKIVNNRTGKADMTLTELDKMLSDEYVEGLLKDQEAFMYGDKGAQKCMDKMFGADMFRKSWREYPECTSIRGKFVSPFGTRVDDHCIPIISDDTGSNSSKGSK